MCWISGADVQPSDAGTLPVASCHSTSHAQECYPLIVRGPVRVDSSRVLDLTGAVCRLDLESLQLADAAQRCGRRHTSSPADAIGVPGDTGHIRISGSAHSWICSGPHNAALHVVPKVPSSGTTVLCTRRQPLHLCNSIGKVSGLVGRQRPAADTASLHIAREYTHSSSTSHKAASSNAGGSPGSKADTRRVSQSEASAYQKAGRGGSHQQVYSGSNRHGPATSLKERQPARPLPHQQQQRQLQQEPLDTVVATRKLPELLPLTMEQQQQDHVLLQPAITASAAGTTGTLKSDNLLSMNCTSTSSGKNGLSAASRLQLQQQQRPRLSNRLLTKPEVLSPAGGWQQLRAAVENGADAVYFGVTGFNARAR